jgi:ABC-type multidrug transport system ATPase subunit
MRGVSPDKRARQIKEALELLLLSEKREVLIKGLTLSERKRLSLANALVGNPSVLILDEPLANASAEDAELIKDLVSMLGEKKVIIILTERTSDADALASQIGIISGGETVLWESLEQIKLKLDGDRNALLKTFLAFTDGAREA